MTRPKQPSRATLDRIVKEFNKRFPVGTELILRKDSGEVRTKVRHPAEVMGGHSAVGWFEGVSGCYSIEDGRIRPVPAETEPQVAQVFGRKEIPAVLLPPPDGLCAVCGIAHDPTNPHNANSIYYQVRFNAKRKRLPTWADATAHCAPHIQAYWREELAKLDAWTEPPAGELPIADPPAESIREAIAIGTITERLDVADRIPF